MVYVIVGFLWILGGDVLLAALPGESQRSLAWLGSSKAAIFLLLSAIALYALLRRRDRTATVSAATARATKMLLAITIGLVVAGGYMLYRLHSEAELKNWHATLESHAAAQAAHLEEWLEEHLVATQLVAESEFLTHEISAWRVDPQDGRAREILAHIDALRVLHGSEIVSVSVAAANGPVLFSVGDSYAAPSDTDLIAAALKAQRPTFGTPYVEQGAARRPLVAVAQALGSQTIGPAAVAMVTVLNMRSALETAHGRLGTAGHETIETLLVFSDEGQLTTLGGGPGATWQTLDEQTGPQASQGLGARIAAGNGAASAEVFDYRGTAVIAAARRVPETNWYVVAKTDWAEVRGEALQLANLGLAILTFMALLLVVSIGWIRRETQRATAAQLASAELRIGALTQHFELINRYANDIVLLVDSEGRIAEANQRAIETYGQAREQLIGSKAEDLLGASHEGKATFRRFEDTGRLALMYETSHRRRDGTEFPVEVSARRFELDGRTYSQAIVRDISERRKREEEIAQVAAERDAAARQLRRQFDDMPFGCVVMDQDLRVVDINPAFERLFGWQKHELVGDVNFDKIVAPQDIAGVRRVIEGIRDVTGYVDNVNRNVTRDGRVLTCRWTNTALRGPDGEFAGLMAMCEDLSALENLRQEASTQAAMFRTLAETTAVGVFQIRADGWVTYANPALMEMLDVRPGNLGDLARGLYLDSDERQRVARVIDGVMKAGTMAPQEFRYTRRGGSRGWVLVQAQTVKDGTGAVAHLVGTATDITDLKDQEAMLEAMVSQRTAELSAAKESAERANAAKTAFLASMSHELRTPLNSIVGFTEVLLEQTTGPLNRKQEQQLIIVRNAAQRQRALISDLLDTTRLESGRFAVDKTRVAAADLVRRVAAEFDHEAGNKGLALSCQVGNEVGEIETDTVRFEQVVANLVSNAIKYTQQGSVSVRARQADGELVVSVTDTGMGIAEQDAERIFEPFVQLPTSAGQHNSGIGLGLALSRKIAEALGGTVEVESVLGSGSTFEFRVPVAGGPGRRANWRETA